MDRIGAAVLLLLAIPWCVLIILAIRLDSIGPVFSRDRRIGQWGVEFDVLRFRSSTSQTPPGGRTPDDHGSQPLSRVGRFLRRYSLDELPQLVNVLKGDMSFVGPRPQPPLRGAEDGTDLRRLMLKPGLTGLWLEDAQSDSPEVEPVDLDRYLQHWSLALDLAILWRSVHGVLRGAGAH
jgi:lipopolysaccharide/colanic/teichoic acid biosynthesis glycosyltransferase